MVRFNTEALAVFFSINMFYRNRCQRLAFVERCYLGGLRAYETEDGFMFGTWFCQNAA